MNNAMFGKIMENVRNRVNIRLKTSAKQHGRMVKKSNYKSSTIFSENLTAVLMHRTTVKLDKLIVTGLAILDESKRLMFSFKYDYVEETWPGEQSTLIMTDTDGLLMEIKTEDVYSTGMKTSRNVGIT